jgi:hypothetical protein
MLVSTIGDNSGVGNILDRAEYADFKAGHSIRADSAIGSREAYGRDLSLRGSVDDGSKSNDDKGKMHSVSEVEWNNDVDE